MDKHTKTIIGIVAVVAVIGIAAVWMTASSIAAEIDSSDGIGTFYDNGNEIELLNGKPVIRMFSTTWCPHCKWVTPAFEEVAAEYESQIVAMHWELDIGDNTLTPEYEGGIPVSESELFKQTSPGGGVPAFLFGGKYVRGGTAFEGEDNLEKEKEDFRKVIDALLEE